ncbi:MULTISPECIES: curli assembly protein CsgF [Modicisalibacter]|nr:MULTISPECIES: curli assembly protein CsgF [Modicisalibacter]
MRMQPLLLSLALATGAAQAGELVYRPINPSFGGDPLNGNYLLNKAQAQDDNKDPNAPDFGSFSETDLFIQDLRNSLVSNAIDDAVNATDPGRTSTIDSAELKIKIVSNGNGGFQMQITDRRTGEVTNINLGSAANNF